MSSLSEVTRVCMFGGEVGFFPVFGSRDFSFKRLRIISLMSDCFGGSRVVGGVCMSSSKLVGNFVRVSKARVYGLCMSASFRDRKVNGRLVRFTVGRLRTGGL